MADASWQEIFADYSPEALDLQIADLKKQVGVFSSGQVGSKTFVKDLAALKDQLSSAIRVKNTRAGTIPPAHGVIDFSGIRV